MQSTSPLFKLDWVDFFKSLRGGIVVLVAVYLQQIQTAGPLPTDPTALIKFLEIAGTATVVELGRRFFTNHAI